MKSELIIKRNFSFAVAAIESINHKCKINFDIWQNECYCNNCLLMSFDFYNLLNFLVWYEQNIYGARYKYSNCSNFDYYFKCNNSSNQTHIGHKFEKLEWDKIEGWTFVRYTSQAHDLRSANLSVQLKDDQKRRGKPKFCFRRDRIWRRGRSKMEARRCAKKHTS